MTAIGRLALICVALLAGPVYAQQISGGCATIGTTLVCSGATTTTIAGLTLSGGTLSGATALPASGQISSVGEIGIFAAPTAALFMGGTYTTANADILSVTTTLASSVTTTQRGLRFSATFNPSGASLTTINGISSAPSLGFTAFTITNFNANIASITIGAGFSGVVSEGAAYSTAAPTVSGGSMTLYSHFRAGGIANGNSISSGTVTNRQFYATAAITTAAAGGTANNRSAELVVPSGGASSGTANNRGIYITGNGGTASGGTVNNFALYSDSTAISAVLGGFQLGSNTALTLTSGALGLAKIAASASAPGAGGGKVELVCGTNAGTAKLVAYAGTSGTATLILDNIGAGVTGC